VALQDFDERRGTKRHENNLSDTHKLTQNTHRLCYKNDTLLKFFNEIKNELILITVVHKILKISDIRDCGDTLYSSKVKQKKINC